jgi:DeoR family transcriptional regulator of aga operon
MEGIIATVVENGSATVESLAHEFDVSAATVRRDLEVLEEQQVISRTRGGATTHIAFNDVPLSLKVTQNLAEKSRIARAAFDMIGDALVVGMTGGTTIFELARLMSRRRGITVVTNALNVAGAVVNNPGLRVFIAGGQVRSSSQETVGPTAEQALSEYNIDISFIGVDGVDVGAGCTNYDPIGARVNAAMHARSHTTAVLADATKLGRVTLATVCRLADVDVLITDRRAPRPLVRQIEAQGCAVQQV